MPIAETVYRILWENVNPGKGFKLIEKNIGLINTLRGGCCNNNQPLCDKQDLR